MPQEGTAPGHEGVAGGGHGPRRRPNPLILTSSLGFPVTHPSALLTMAVQSPGPDKPSALPGTCHDIGGALMAEPLWAGPLVRAGPGAASEGRPSAGGRELLVATGLPGRDRFKTPHVEEAPSGGTASPGRHGLQRIEASWRELGGQREALRSLSWRMPRKSHQTKAVVIRVRRTGRMIECGTDIR